jgi:hypothetical protein
MAGIIHVNGNNCTIGYSAQRPIAFFAIHHTAGSKNEPPTTNPTFCNTAYKVDGCGSCRGYDFVITADGTIVAGDYPSAPRWQSNGCHSEGCNCQTLGFGFTGCFSLTQACSNIDATRQFEVGQNCALACIYYRKGWIYSNAIDKLRPHHWCDRNGGGNPCNADVDGTECCGTRYVDTSNGHGSTHDWNDAGQSWCNTIAGKAFNMYYCTNCFNC